MIVAIDGPAGSGKSSTVKLISEKLGWKYLDTGAMYRAVTVFFMTHNLSTESKNKIQNVLDQIKIEFRRNGEQQIWLNGKNVTQRIRESDVTNKVSSISSLPDVRAFLVLKQREFAKLDNVIIEGRDIGTKVFPRADLKVFLTASIESRALRRKGDLKKSSKEISLEQIKKDIELRDKTDMEREFSPLRIAEDAVVIDTTDMSLVEQTNKIIKLIEHIAQ